MDIVKSFKKKDNVKRKLLCCDINMNSIKYFYIISFNLILLIKWIIYINFLLNIKILYIILIIIYNKTYMGLVIV